MNKTLFIGGPKDGQREIWPLNGGITQQVVTPAPGHSTLPPHPSCSFGLNTHTYDVEQFRTSRGIFSVAAHSSVPDIMEQLFKGYRYHRRPRNVLTNRKLSRIHNQLKQAAI